MRPNSSGGSWRSGIWVKAKKLDELLDVTIGGLRDSALPVLDGHPVDPELVGQLPLHDVDGQSAIPEVLSNGFQGF